MELGARQRRLAGMRCENVADVPFIVRRADDSAEDGAYPFQQCAHDGMY
jgi:hypothetical protein